MFHKIGSILVFAIAAIAASGAHAQSWNYLGDSHWNVRPGVYRLVNQRSHLCATPTLGGGLVTDFLVQGNCSTTDLRPDLFRILPLASQPGRYTIRTETSAVVSDLACATVARNVWFGNPRIDFDVCDGRMDQSFSFVPTPGNLAHAVGEEGTFFVETATMNQCWDVRDGSASAGADLLQSSCSGANTEMFFFLAFVEPLTFSGDIALAAEAGLLADPIGQCVMENGPSGPVVGCQPHAMCPAAFAVTAFDRLPQQNLLGADISPSEIGVNPIPQDTTNDTGCRQACIADCSCVAYSWVKKGAQDAAHSLCWLKHNPLPPLTADPNVTSGHVRASVNTITVHVGGSVHWPHP